MQVAVALGAAMTVEMHVPGAIMIVMMEMPSFANELHAEKRAEHDEHESDQTFRGDGKRFGNGDSEHQHNCAHEQQHRRVPEPPAQTDQPRGAPGRPFSEHGRYCGKVVRIQGMTKAEDKPETEN